MNDLKKENIKIALCNALADDKVLMQKDVAANFGTDSASISYIKNPTQWGKAKAQLWSDLDEWIMSGKKLRDYVPPRLFNAPTEEEPEPTPEPSIYDKLEAQEKKAKEKKEVRKKPEPEPQKEPSVSKGAKKFLKGKKAEKLFNEKPEGKKSEPKIDTKPEEKSSQKRNPNIEFDKEMKEAIESLNSAMIIPIPMSLHGPNSEPNVISQKFDIEVEVRLSVKEKK